MLEEDENPTPFERQMEKKEQKPSAPKEEGDKGRAGIEGEGDMWNHLPYPCPSGTAHHKKLFQMKKSENANGHEAIRRKKKVILFLQIGGGRYGKCIAVSAIRKCRYTIL